MTHKTLQQSSLHMRQSILFNHLVHFFDQPYHFSQLEPVLTRKLPFSLRALDFFVTNYAVKHNILLNGISIHSDYRCMLKAFSKKLFDPFCRRDRISVQFACDPQRRTFCTTVAQLAFFRWAIQKGVLQYVDDHKDQICVCVKD